MPEIKVEYNQIKLSVEALQRLLNGTGYSQYCISKFLNQSNGKMCDSTNEFYSKLMETESILLSIIEKTTQALKNAGISFNNADQEVKQKFDKVRCDI